MSQLSFKQFITLVLFFMSSFALPVNAEQVAEDELLPPDQAFKASLKVLDKETLQISYDIAEGYYLYNSKFRFVAKTSGVELGEAVIPPGKKKNDPFFGEIETQRHHIKISLPYTLSSSVDSVEIAATAQGCADVGVCYPPHTTLLKVKLEPSLVENVSQQAKQALTSATNAIKSLGADLGLDSDEEDEGILSPDQAFQARVVGSEGKINVRVKIADKHYLYQDKFKFKLLSPNNAKLGKAEFSPAEEKNDPFFGKIKVYHNSAEISLPVSTSKGSTQKGQIQVTYQGCSEAAGICYPPQKKVFDINIIPAKVAAPVTEKQNTEAAQASSENRTEQDKIADKLAHDNLFLTLLTFFGLGLLLAFTPCVFPMIPILSSIIVGQGKEISTGRAFRLSMAYVLAMAFTYTAAGIIVGLLGVNVQVWFQNPIVLSVFAAIFVLLSLSMFGFYELQMPASIQSKLTTVSNEQKSGSLKGAMVMGFLSALIVGPCVTAPLVGALIYIAETGDAVFGGMALFSLSMGMGAPLIMIGTSAGKLLPKAGPWMDTTKAIFGILLLGLAIWMLERILPVEVTMLLAAALIITSGIYCGALESTEGKSPWYKLWKSLGIILLIYGAALFVGALSGGNSFFTPLKSKLSVVSAGAQQSSEHIAFEQIKGIDGLNAALARAKAQKRNVMLDFYADWCISCKEMEQTFDNPIVKQALGNALLIQADVTANDEQDQALLKHFGLFGPPGIIFYNKQGEEQKNYRVVGFMDAEKFSENVRKAFAN